MLAEKKDAVAGYEFSAIASLMFCLKTGLNSSTVTSKNGRGLISRFLNGPAIRVLFVRPEKTAPWSSARAYRFEVATLTDIKPIFFARIELTNPPESELGLSPGALARWML